MKFFDNNQNFRRLSKFIILVIFYIILISPFITICFSTNNNNNLKRDPSMMEYFNNFFREDNSDQIISSNFQNSRFSQSHKNSNSQKLQNLKNDDEQDNNEDEQDKYVENNHNEFKFKETNYNNFPHYAKKPVQPAPPAKKDLLDKSKNITKKNGKNKKIKKNFKSQCPHNTPLKKGEDFLTKIKTNPSKNSNLIFCDWFMISSDLFKDKKVFPPIKVENNTYIDVEYDENNFRKNHAYNMITGKDKPLGEKFFWLRLSGLNLFYSTSSADLNVLGSISISEIENILEETGSELVNDKTIYCFLIKDKAQNILKICGLKLSNIQILFCQLNAVIGGKQSICEKKVENNFKKIIQPMIIIPKSSRNCNEDWNYKNKGNDWECECTEGKEQSPIDLPRADLAIDSPVSPLFNYIRVNTKIEEDTIDGFLTKGSNLKIRIIENSLKIFHPKFGRIVTVDGAIYNAEEIVIHTPSEHKLNGKKYDLELQIIHYGQTKGDIAKQVVLSFLFEGIPGEYNKFFDSIDPFNLPNMTDKEKELCEDIYIPNIFYSTDEKLETSMKKFDFFTYQGSLTAPPCTENTIMYVASNPLPLSTTTLKLLQEALRKPDYIDQDNNHLVENDLPENDREVQPRNGRPVFYYNHEKYCGPDKLKTKNGPTGHYEKYLKSKNKLIYVDNDKPSGMPNSFVISKEEALGEQSLEQMIK